MSAKRTCPQCGSGRSDDSLSGLCPRCLVRFSLDELIGEGGPPVEATALLPYAFGDYEVIEELARGGMGVVYRAIQTSLQRTVALKMVAAGHLASPTAVLRFKTEAAAAANLDHPHIVPIYEIGEHSGQHYFTMKLIKGASLAQRLEEFSLPRPGPQPASDKAESSRGRRSYESGCRAPIRSTSFCRALRLATLLAKVAEAVQYAHQRGILHRDLKPGNILIDQNGEPHVTDFGLAKRVESDRHLTLSGEIIGTPAYMAPEQATGDYRQVGAAADVFSLGVMLYQLLTGRLPFAGATPAEVFHSIVHEEPPAPSAVNPAVPRDLETICVKCLEKNVGKRYGSAKAVADELNRFTAGEPIEARPVGRTERLWRWSQRNPALASYAVATTLLLFMVVVGAPIAVWREAALRRQAEAQTNKSEQVAQFLKSVLAGVGSSVARGREVTILNKILDDTAERVGKELGGHPDIEAELYQTLGETAFQLGNPAKAETWLSKALELRIQFFGEETGEVADTLDAVALAAYAQGNYTEAECINQRALELQRKVHGNNHRNVATSLSNLACLRAAVGDFPTALVHYEDALAMRRGLFREDSAYVATSIAHLARSLRQAGRLAEAEAWQAEALARRRNLPPFGEHPDIAMSLNELGLIRRAQGRPDEAVGFFQDAYNRRSRLLRSDNSSLAESAENLALALCDTEEYMAAEKLARQSATIRKANYPDDWRGFHAQAIVGMSLLGQQRLAEAERELLAGYHGMKAREERIAVPDKPRLREVISSLVRLCQSTGRTAQAAEWRGELERCTPKD